ncbi:MAG: hypothetical protein RL365_1436, partial [Bacteroidota bacterium]
ITGKLETLETNHKLEIYKKEVNINELKTEYLKYKKQGSLYKSIKTFCDDHKNYEMQLYENKADCKRIKKRFTTGFKKVKLLFAVFATAQPGMDRKMHNRDLLYFWSDSSITIESNFKSYLPDYLLSNKIQAWPFLNYQGEKQYDRNIHVYREVNRIIEDLNTQLFIKLISYIDYKKPLEINEKIIDLTNEINASNLKFNEEKLSLSSIKQTFSMDTLKKHRAGDSLTLLTLENFYNLKLKEQSENKKLVSINYSKYMTTKINGVEISNAPLSITAFRNGDQIMLARTKSEWEKFIQSKTPAYKYKDFDESNTSYGLIYNYYAYVDLREVAPYGFHKLNLLDYNYLENQVVFKSTKFEKCWCTDGKEIIYEWCSYCSHWTKEQRKYNVCRYCNNKCLKITGKKKCSNCNGTGQFKSISLKKREIPIYPGLSLINELWKVGYKSIVEDNGSLSKITDIWNKEDAEFQIFICKDRELKKLDDNFNSKQIGNLELMSNFLNVTKFRNGDPIKYIEDPIEWELAIKNKIPAYCYYMNQVNSDWKIYNDIALNDPREIIPNGWRKITEADRLHISSTLGINFDIRSQFVYGVDYPGFRAQNGEFITRGLYKPDQYVICVRDAQINSSLQTPTKYSLFMGQLYQANDSVSNIRNESFQENISESKVKPIDWKNISHYDLPDEKSFVTEYSKYYNNSGVEVIKTLVENDFKYLFKENHKIKIIGLSELILCKEGKYERFSTYDEFILGLIIEQGKNENEMKCTYLYKKCKIYGNDVSKKNGEVSSSTFYRSGDFTFTNEKGVKLTFHFFPHMNCYTSNNPLENLVIEFDDCYGKDNYWISTGIFDDPYGDFRNYVIPHIDEINQFFNNY